jgi:hypothetical protein
MSQFKIIIEDAINRADRVNCDIATFRRGLKEMQILLNDRVECEPGMNEVDGEGDEEDALRDADEKCMKGMGR